jgi:hypothetical protein
MSEYGWLMKAHHQTLVPRSNLDLAITMEEGARELP